MIRNEGFRKSSYSGQNGNCVEVRRAGAIDVRDSKDKTGPVLSFSTEDWKKFLAVIK